MYCNTQHFAGTLPIISISRGHFTLTDIKDMEAGRDPDLVKIQNCSEHTQSSWNQIRSWILEKTSMWSCFQIEVWIAIRRLIFQQRCQWSGQHKKNPNSWQIQVCGDPSPSSRWCHDLSVVCWLLTSLRSAVSPWEGGRRNILENNLCLLFIYLPPSWEWIYFCSQAILIFEIRGAIS